MNKLTKYNSKRNFSKTKEPKGIVKKSHKKLKYVLQLHYASHKHYDLRLEYDGVLISFAIPKNIPLTYKEKRLAVHVEDHPLSYANFEGTIPEGEYGAGRVLIVDKGYWYPIDKVNLNKGFKFHIEGVKLKGSWNLIKYKESNFLIIKEKDDIEITSKDKVIFKKEKVTKGDIVDYYKLVSDRMMPYLQNRLISTVRSPDSIEDKFFMKHLDNDMLGKKKIKGKYYYYINDIDGLISEVQMNSYEFHIWNTSVDNLKNVDFITFDLDPDENLDISVVRDAVHNLKKILDKYKLKSFLKTSGGKGYHIMVPLKNTTYKVSLKIAKEVVDLLVNTYPDKYTCNMRKSKRVNKVFIDYYRNNFGSTCVCPYSLRLKEGASISMPISYSKLDKIKPNEVTIKNVKDYLKGRDPWYNFFD